MAEPTASAPVRRSVKNTSGADIAKGIALKYVATGYKEVAPAGAGELASAGVSASEIKDDEWGVSYVGGIAIVVAGATCTVGGEVAANASGKAIDATTGARVLGVALDAGAADAEIEVDLNIGAVSP